MPGTIAVRKSIDRPQSQKQKMDRTTGLRTGALKKENRYERAMGKFLGAWVDVAVSEKLQGSNPGTANAEMKVLENRLVDFDNDMYRYCTEPNRYVFLFKNTAYIFLNGVIEHKYSKQADYFETLGDPGTHFIPGGSSCVKDIKGTRFSFEICRDHGQGVLAKSQVCYSNRSLPKLAQPADIHIILSDWIENSYFPTRVGGFTLHASTNSKCSGVFNDKGVRVTAKGITGKDSPRELGWWILDLSK